MIGMEDRTMEAALIATPTHRRPAVVAALFALVVAALTGCHGGVDVAIINIPADTQVTVSVETHFSHITTP